MEEAATSRLGDYAGVYNDVTETIDIRYDADGYTALHEAAHTWFNGTLFPDRWIGEAWAEYYGVAAGKEIGADGDVFTLTPTLEAAKIPLNAWGTIGSEPPNTEDYAYAASYHLAQLIAGRTTTTGLQKVWKAAHDGAASYQPPHAVAGAAAEKGVSADVAGWQRLLDLLEERTGANYDDLWRTWVTTAGQQSLMDARVTARAQYSQTVTAAGSWELPYAIRLEMGAWDFGKAENLMTDAKVVLADRTTIASRAASLSLTVPTTLRTAFEAGPTFDVAKQDAAQELSALAAIGSATTALGQAQSPVEWVGLLFADPARQLVAARATFENGKATDATADADAARAEREGAADVGRTRVAHHRRLTPGDRRPGHGRARAATAAEACRAVAGRRRTEHGDSAEPRPLRVTGPHTHASRHHARTRSANRPGTTAGRPPDAPAARGTAGRPLRCPTVTLPSLHRSISAVLAGTFTLRFSTGLTGGLLVYYIAKMPTHGGPEISALELGAITAAYFLAELTLSPAFGVLSDHLGAHRVMQWGPIFGAVAVIMTGLPVALIPITVIVWLGITRLLEGAAAGSSIPSILGYIAIATSGDEQLRGRTVARFEAATLAGLGGGVVAAGLAVRPRRAPWASSSTPWSTACRSRSTASQSTISRAARRPRRGGRGSPCRGGANPVRLGALPPGRRQSGRLAPGPHLDRDQRGGGVVDDTVGVPAGADPVPDLLRSDADGRVRSGPGEHGLAVAMLVFFAGLLYWGNKFKALRRTTIIFIGIGGGLLMLAAIFGLNHSIDWGIPLQALMAVGACAGLFVLAGATPAALGLLADISEAHPEDRGAIMGLYSVFLAVGQITGALAGGAAADWRGIDGILAASLGLLVIALLPIHRLRSSEHLLDIRAEEERHPQLRSALPGDGLD